MPQESLQMQMNNRPLTIRKSDNHHFPLVVGNSQVLSRNQYIAMNIVTSIIFHIHIILFLKMYGIDEKLGDLFN